jgi:hypothetical protein
MTTMRANGITYDTGFISAGRTTREPFDPQVVRREMQIIRQDLHCDAVRVTGGHPDRLETAARFAAEAGLEVWISPFTNELNEEALLDILADCAERAERLRREGADIVVVAGAELSLFMPGLLPGNDPLERIRNITTADLDRRREIAVSMRQRLNHLLTRAVAVIRQHFGGKITYAAIPFEGVDWTSFDFAAIDCYRMTAVAAYFRPSIHEFVAKGKPVAITEFGCATFHGASCRGAHGGAIVEYDEHGHEKQLDADNYLRDEQEQAREILDLLTIFREEGVDSVFVNTFSSYHLPHRDDARHDLDLASFGLVRVLENTRGTAYPDMPWEPKAAFAAIADAYRQPHSR